MKRYTEAIDQSADQVFEQRGFKKFFIALLIAVLFGFSIRLWVTPRRVETWARAQIAASELQGHLNFASATLSLSDGPFPEIAVLFNKVDWQSGIGCQGPAPARAKSIRIPLRFWRSLLGTPMAGRVQIESLIVDLDGLKQRCETGVAHPSSPAAAPSDAKLPHSADVASAWVNSEIWAPSDLARIEKILTGISITRAELQFEDRMKSVILENASADIIKNGVEVSTQVQVPPATVFGETLPVFSISSTVMADDIRVKIRADLNEGSLEGVAELKPIVGPMNQRELKTDLRLAVKDLPLSLITPLLEKSGVVSGTFKPKFSWLDCKASVSGIFSRLFVESPVALSQCQVSGKIGRIKIDSATRQANGHWEPITLVADKVVISRVLESFEANGLNGIFSDLGELTGRLVITDPDHAELAGKIEGSVMRFAGSEGVALQTMSIGKFDSVLEAGHWKVLMQDFAIEGGSADLEARANLDRRMSTGTADVKLKALKLSQRVEKMVFTGPVDEIKGFGSAKIDAGKLAKLQSQIEIKNLRGSEVMVESAVLEGTKASADSMIQMSMKSAAVDLPKASHVFSLLRPALLGFDGGADESGNLRLSRFVVKGRFADDGFLWTKATANIGGPLNLSSEGQVRRDQTISAEVEANFPSARRLKWQVTGNWLRPKHRPDSDELRALLSRAGLPPAAVTGSVPASLLGLPKENSAPSINSVTQ